MSDLCSLGAAQLRAMADAIETEGLRISHVVVHPFSGAATCTDHREVVLMVDPEGTHVYRPGA